MHIPLVESLVENTAGDPRFKGYVPVQIEAVGHMLCIAQDLGLRGILLRPDPILFELG